MLPSFSLKDSVTLYRLLFMLQTFNVCNVDEMEKIDPHNDVILKWLKTYSQIERDLDG